MLYFIFNAMIYNIFTHTTKLQQKHNKFYFVADNRQQSQCLLWICCVRNFLFHCKITLFYNKTTKI
jgi:hypothetical protein